ncbi:MAG: ROK family protein [Spirochaetaceae bacterium]|jgi:glucokinase|nr:ROK family protein [Spirochaetaceae bacterium]
MTNPYVIGLDVGGTKIACGLFDRERRLVAERRLPSNPGAGPAEFFDGLAGEIQGLLDAAKIPREGLRGIGLGMPSFILFEKGYIVKTSNLVNIRDFPARDYLSGRLGGIPVFLDNDARTAALAESRFGAGRGFPHMLYCPVSTGISSGIVIDGKLFRGSYGWSGESGHMIATPGEGLLCGCGNRGCYMSWCSGSMIVKHIRQWIAAGEPTLMTELAGGAENIECRHLEAAWNRGDALAVRALNQMARYLGLWFFNLYVTFNINCLVLGGGLLNLGEGLLGPVRRIFDEYNRAGYPEASSGEAGSRAGDMPVYFKTAELGDQAGMIGAAELIFSGETQG